MNFQPPPPPLSIPPPPPQMPQYGPSGLIPPISVVDGLARLSLFLGLIGLCCGLSGPFAAVFGFVSLKRIGESGGVRRGTGLAVAGVVLGVLETIGALFVSIVIAGVHR